MLTTNCERKTVCFDAEGVRTCRSSFSSVFIEPDVRPRFRVQMINNIGLEEVGIDGGGVFREFLSELIKTAFDPNRGFFM